MRRLPYIIALLALIISCSPSPVNIYSGDGDDGGDGGDGGPKTVSISELKSYYKGSTHQIIDDLTVEAIIVANDIMGELDGRMVIQDSSGGIEVYIDSDEIYNSYPINNTITLNCSGLWFASRGGDYGAVVMGAYPTSYDVVDGVSLTQFASRVSSIEECSTALNPSRYTLSEIGVELVSSCIIIESLVFAEGDPWDSLFDYDQYTEYGYCRRTMECQLSGETIELYIPTTINYSTVPLMIFDNYEGSYYVLLDRYAGNYSIQLINMGN